MLGADTYTPSGAILFPYCAHVVWQLSFRAHGRHAQNRRVPNRIHCAQRLSFPTAFSFVGLSVTAENVNAPLGLIERPGAVARKNWLIVNQANQSG